MHMNEPLVFMFSGQGSQYYHMGKELFKENIVFRQSMHEMDAMAARRIGTSIVEEIYHPAKRVSDPFDSILFPTLQSLWWSILYTKFWKTGDLS